MSAADTAKSINAFLKRQPKGDVPPPPSDREPIGELVYSFLLWEASTSRADNAYKRILSQFVDFNDLRVSRRPELEAALGKTYPNIDERIMRLQAALQDVYVREYEVSLGVLDKLSKRDARKYLESLEGMPPYVAARVTLFVLGAHAVPVERRLLDQLIEAGVLEEGTDIEKAQGLLERHIKAEDGVAAYQKLQNFAENGGAKKRVTSQKKAASQKKATTRKKTTAAKTTTRKKSASAASGSTSRAAGSRSASKGSTTRKKAAARSASSKRASRS